MRKSMWRAVVLRGTVRAAALGCCGCGGGRLHWRGAADADQVIVSCGGVGQAKRARPPAAVNDKAMVVVRNARAEVRRWRQWRCINYYKKR